MASPTAPVLPVELDVHQVGAFHLPIRLELLDDQLERHFLMRVGVENSCPNSTDQFLERRIARQIRAQDDRVGEKSDRALRFAALTIRGERGDAQIRESRPPIDRQLECRQQQHEQAAPQAPAQLVQVAHGLGSERQRHNGRIERRLRRSWSVSRQRLHRRIAEPPRPVVESSPKPLAKKLGALPLSVVRIL